jgi:hypothetical protein
LCILEAKGGKEVEILKGRSSRREKLRFRSKPLQENAKWSITSKSSKRERLGLGGLGQDHYRGHGKETIY